MIFGIATLHYILDSKIYSRNFNQIYGDLASSIHMYMNPSSVTRDKNCARPVQHRCDVVFTISDSVIQKFGTRVSTLLPYFKNMRLYFLAFGFRSLIAVRKLFNNMIISRT